MAVAGKRPGFSWMWLLLLSGLSILSWVSTYTGIMELIMSAESSISTSAEASSGSRKPPDRPTATTFPFQKVSR